MRTPESHFPSFLYPTLAGLGMPRNGGRDQGIHRSDDSLFLLPDNRLTDPPSSPRSRFPVISQVSQGTSLSQAFVEVSATRPYTLSRPTFNRMEARS